MELKEILARVQRAKTLINSVTVSGKPAWQAMLIATNDLETVEHELQIGVQRLNEAQERDQEEA